MKTQSSAAQVRALTTLREISKKDWDQCSNPSSEIYNPFISYDFLLALEESGSATAKTGWAPCHLMLQDGSGGVAAVAPCYLKNHSYGEYVFDHGWANAYERAGGSYYPKLQTAVPFTPVTGRRFLVRDGYDRSEAQTILSAAAMELARLNRASSWHVTFLTENESQLNGAHELFQRTATQYHWFNQGYGSFDDFLGSLSSRKRKTVRKEREQAKSAEIEIEPLTGSAITERHWDAFFAFYTDTGNRKWGVPYLNRKFFSLIGARMADRILLIMAKREGRYIAGALNFIGGDALYGRYWGCLETHNLLHFELCYYQAIDYAIAHNIPKVEAGAQGEHKLARGYVPVTTHSLHYFADPALGTAVRRFLEQERVAVEREQELLAELTPYKKCSSSG